MPNEPFQPPMARIYCSRINLTLFVANLQIECANAVSQGYHDSDVFDIAPDYVPVFLKPLRRQDVHSFGQGDVIAMDISPEFLAGCQWKGYYVLTNKLKVEWKQIQDLEYTDIMFFFPAFIPFSFVEAIYVSDDRTMSDICLDLADEPHFSSYLSNRLKMASVFAESEETSYDLKILERPPRFESAPTVARTAGRIRALLYSLQEAKNGEAILAALYYGLACNPRSRNLSKILAFVLSEKEAVVKKATAIHVIEIVFEYLLENLSLDRRVVDAVFEGICGVQSPGWETIRRMDQNTFDLLKQAGKLEALLMGDIHSDEYFGLTGQPTSFQGIACLRRFETNQDRYSSEQEIKRFVKKAGPGFFYFYICYLAAQKGLRGLRIRDDVLYEKSQFFEWLICRYLASVHEAFCRFDAPQLERMLLEELIRLQFPDCHQSFVTLVGPYAADLSRMSQGNISYNQILPDFLGKPPSIEELAPLKMTGKAGDEPKPEENLPSNGSKKVQSGKRESRFKDLNRKKNDFLPFPDKNTTKE